METVGTETALERAARKAFTEDALLRWQWRAAEASGGHRPDTVAQVEAGNRRRTFEVEFKLQPTARSLDSLSARKHRHPLLLIAPRISESIIKLCHQRGINAADLNGRVFINVDGLVIDRVARARSRVRPMLPTVRPFATKSSRLARAILANPKREWTLPQLAQRTGLSAGLASRVLREMENQGWIKRYDRRIAIRQADALLDAWAAADNWEKRTTVQQYSVLANDLRAVIAKLAPQRYALTQWSGAILRFPYMDAPVESAYVPQFPSPDAEKALGARRVENGGRLWLIVPTDPGVFLETRNIAGVPVVCDAQLYLDLIRAGMRGPEQAKALRAAAGFNSAP